MIVDCHTHIWQSPEQLGELDLGSATKAGMGRAGGAGGRAGIPGGRSAPAGVSSSRYSAQKSPWRVVPAADPDHHWAESRTVDKTIVLGFKSRYLRAEVPNRYVAEYVGRFPQ